MYQFASIFTLFYLETVKITFSFMFLISLYSFLHILMWSYEQNLTMWLVVIDNFISYDYLKYMNDEQKSIKYNIRLLTMDYCV